MSLVVQPGQACSGRQEGGAGFDSFMLLIRSGSSIGDYHETFDSLPELIGNVAARLTPAEIREGVLHKLTTFDPKKAKEGYVKNRWRNWSTYAYLS